MILYFSGTGNSEYVARKIQSLTEDSLVSLNDLLKSKENGTFESERPYVIVSPTYAWRLPRVVEEVLKNSSFAGNKKVYFIMTCGKDIGNVEKSLSALCQEKQLVCMGVTPVVMPDNYITLYPAPSKEEIKKIIQKADPVVAKISERIIANQPLESNKGSLSDVLKSGWVNKAFYSFSVSAKGYYATESCINCGKCALICPLNNIQMEGGRPIWGDHCTQCMACISTCPTTAIEYKNRTQGKARYWCPNDSELG